MSNKAKELVIKAERFRVNVNAPSGINQNVDLQMLNLDIDGQFFHVTCHLEEGLKSKIEKGEFVELEKLLPKPRGRTHEHKLDLVYKDGHSYFIPVTSDMKINSIQRWEQAFRVYAAVYSQANPLRAGEIWQYIHTINVAAGSYVWDNVYSYDITFRQLMHQYPQRSWAKLYNQMWNLAMREPLQKNFSNNGQGMQNFGYGQSGNNGNSSKAKSGTGENANNSSGKRKKPNYCWAFNKGFCKDGAACHFINRCSYCDALDHALPNCKKAKEANKGN